MRRTASAPMKITGIALAAATVLLTACNSSGAGHPKASSSVGSSNPLVAKYEAEYQALVTNTSPNITIPALTKPAPTGKTVEIITCAVPLCALYTKGATDAAQALGWKTKTIVAPFTPEGFKETWDTVLQDKPDAVVMAAVAPTASVIAQVKQASDEGIVVVGYGLDVQAGGSSPFTFATTSTAALQSAGRAQALTIVNDAKGPANALLLIDPAENNVKLQAAEDQSVLESVGSTVAELNVNSADIGKNVPTEIVTYLQAHPNVQYVVLPNDDFLPGVPQALKSASLNKVKLIGEAANTTSVGLLQNGQLFSSSVHPVVENGWYLVDAIARKMVGDPITDANPVWPQVIANKDTVAKLGDLDDWPHITNKFTAAWNVK